MKFRSCAFAAGIFAALWSGTNVASAFTFFTGKGIVTSASSGCGPWPTTGSLFDVNYRPGGLPSNGGGTETYLVVQLPGIMMTTHAVNAAELSDGSAHTVTAVYLDGLPLTNTGTFTIARTTPAVVSESTEAVSLTARVTRFRGLANCTVSIRASLFRQLNQ